MPPTGRKLPTTPPLVLTADAITPLGSWMNTALSLADTDGNRISGAQPDFRFRTTTAHVVSRSLDFADLPIDTPVEATYYNHGGILHYVLRKMLNPST